MKLLSGGLVCVLCSLLLTGQSRSVATEIPHNNNGCGEGWESHELTNHHRVCLYFSAVEEAAGFEDAFDYCSDLGGSLLQNLPDLLLVDSVLEHVVSHDGDYWIGARKEADSTSGFRWVGDDHGLSQRDANQDLPPALVDDLVLSQDRCGLLSSFSEGFESDDCQHEYTFICQKVLGLGNLTTESSPALADSTVADRLNRTELEEPSHVCPKGSFGQDCQGRCHCLGGAACDVTVNDTVACPDGCQRDWLGPACDRRREKPTVQYYCINNYAGTTNKDPAVQIKVQTNGFETITVYQNSGGTYNPCSPTTQWQPSRTPGSYTLLIPFSLTQRYGSRKAPEVTHICSSSLYRTYLSNSHAKEGKWKIQIKEHKLLNLEYDVEVLVSCDFSDSNRLLATENFKLDTSVQAPSLMSLTAETFKDDVTLDLVQYLTNEPVRGKTELGTPVFLRLEYGKKEGSALHSILPKTCTVSAQNSKPSRIGGTAGTKVAFVDSNGCHVDTAPVPRFIRKDNHTLETDWFPLFGIDDVSLLKFQCGYQICFYEGSCDVTCGQGLGAIPRYNYRRSRRTREVAEGEDTPFVARTVRAVTSG